MEDKKVQDILRLWSDLKNKRGNHEAFWKEITRFCAPDKDFWTVVRETPSRGATHIFDGTAMSAVNLMANSLQGYMASKVSKSFKVGIESHRTLRYKPFEGRMRRYVQDLDDALYWMINQSNFYDAINEVFRIGGTIATACMYVDLVPNESRVVNLVSHPDDVWIAENEVRVVDTTFRLLHMSAKDILRRWPTKVDAEFRKLAETNPYGNHDVLHATLPRDTRDATKIDNMNKPVGSYWILLGKNVLLGESGFDEHPYINWRWSTPKGWTYGWGPSHDALIDVMRANTMSKTMVDAAELSVFPSLNVPAEQKGKLDLRPKGMNPYVDPNRIVMPIQQLGSYPIGRDREEAFERAIREHYMVDMFLMLNQAAENKNRTATEVMEMQSEKAAIMGAITSRIESELFDPLFDRYFEIGMQQGWLPLPPPEAYEMLQGAEIKVDYIGPMSQIQQRFYEKQSYDVPLQRIFAVAQLMPEVLDVIDPTDLGFRLVNESSLPQDLIRDRKEVDAIRQQRAQVQQAAMQSQIAKNNSQALKAMGETDVDNVGRLGGAM